VKKYKYSTQFNFEVSAASLDEYENVSEASLKKLSDLIPEDVDLERNIDITAVAFNAAVVNKFNKNGDGIDSKSAIAIKDLFIHKPCNIEHQKDNVVGHIISAGFSEYKSNNEFIQPDPNSSEPFNICLGAIVYKTVQPEFAEQIIDSVDEDSENYQSVSASWEIGFNEYAVVVGSGPLEERKIIRDQDEVKALSANLKSFGGKGVTEDGEEINRLIEGEIYPLGIGFTNNPAADVKGVVMKDEDDKIENVDNSSVTEKNNHQEKSSLLKDSAVIQEEQNFFSKTMEKQELLKDIEQLLSEKAAAKDFSDEAVANIAKVFHDAIHEKSNEYVEQIEKAKAEQAEAQTQKEELAKTLSELQCKLGETEEKLQSLEVEKTERESQARFDARMNVIEESYTLEDADRKIIAEELSSIDDSEEAFASYQEKLSVVFKSKSNEYIQKLAEEMEAKIQEEVAKRLSEESSQASEEVPEEGSTLIEESLEKANATEVIPNNNCQTSETEESLRSRFAQAFKDSVKVTY